MNNEALIEPPSARASGRASSWWRRVCAPRGLAGASIREDRGAIISVQWLVAIGTSYLVLAAHNGYITDPLPALLILVCLTSAAVLQRIPEDIFEKRLIEPGLLILDSILIVSAMTLSEQAPWDLLLLFFFCVFIAAIGENLIQIGVGSVLLSLVFLMFISPTSVDALTINPNTLIRVPFMLGISIFYGYMTSQVKREKRRMEKLEETMRLKRQFVCALAHDIKTPLNVILGHAELIAGGYGGPQDPTESLSSLKRIRENVDRIVHLVTDFLIVSKLETSTLASARSWLQMNEIVQDVVLQQMVTAREKNLKMTLDLDKDLKPVFGDDNQLQRALWNLVGNAIKFTPADGTIIVTTKMNKKEIAIKVTDTGCGIPKEAISSLFSEFKRLNGTANTEGTGLGLFIVKTIVEAHNGAVAVESELGVGTTFTILLPSSKDFVGGIQPENAGHQAETGISGERRIARHAVDEEASVQ